MADKLHFILYVVSFFQIFSRKFTHHTLHAWTINDVWYRLAHYRGHFTWRIKYIFCIPFPFREIFQKNHTYILHIWATNYVSLVEVDLK